jgi:CRP/FNR family cyclic AMP-dependent transcriptional regulator
MEAFWHCGRQRKYFTLPAQSGAGMFGTGNDQLSTELLAQLAARGNARNYGRGELLIEEGGDSDSLFILLAGELKVFTRAANGRELVYNVLRPGEFFGELFLDGGPRSASVKAVTTSTCIVVGREQFREFMASYPEFAESLVLKLIARVRHATEQLRSVATKDVYGRVTALLNELAVEEGGQRMLDKSVTQQEIADRIGATREMVNHVLRELARGGFLTRDDERRLVLRKALPSHW